MNQPLFQSLAQGAELITPTRSLARHLRQRYAHWQSASGARAWEQPRIHSWDDWCQRQWQAMAWQAEPSRSLLDGVQQQQIWRQIIEDSSGADLLYSTATTQAALHSYRLLRAFRLSPPPEDSRDDGNTDHRAFRDWLSRYQSWLDEQRRIDAEGIADWMAQTLESGAVDSGRRIHHYGFIQLTPQQGHLFEVLRSRGLEVQAVQMPARSPQILRTSRASPRQELRAAARWARALLAADPATRIGILSPDMRARRALLQRELTLILAPHSCLSFHNTEPLPFSLSVGLALADYPMLRCALHTLRLLVHGLEPAPLSNWLLSPWLPGAGAEQDVRARLDARLRRKQKPLLRLPVLLYHCGPDARLPCPVLHKALRAMQQIWRRQPRRQDMVRWLETFRQCLKGLDWPGQGRRGSLEQQLLEKWARTLGSCAGLSELAGRISAAQALGELSRLLHEGFFQAETPDTPVQVMAPETAVGMDFDHVWWLGVHDQDWPPAARPDPFLPLSGQKLARLPQASARLQWQRAEAITRAIRDSCRTLVLSHARQEGERLLRPSPLIPHRAEPLEPALPPEPDPPDQDYRHALLCSAHWQRIPKAIVALPEATVAVSGGATLFRDQALCPFRAFARHRLGARGLEEQELTLVDQRLRGTVLHEVMERLWGTLEGRRALLRETATLRQQVRDAVAEVLEAYCRDQPELFRGLFRECEQQRIEALVADCLEQERRRSDFTVESREQGLAVDFAGLQLQLRADRVDRLADGSRVVLDYKTGSLVSSRKWLGPRPEEPQLPLYALTMDGTLGALAYVQLRRGRVGFVGWARAADILPAEKDSGQGVSIFEARDFDQQMQAVRLELEQLAADFRRGHAAVDPRGPAACQYCDLQALCRIYEYHEGEGGDGDGG